MQILVGSIGFFHILLFTFFSRGWYVLPVFLHTMWTFACLCKELGANRFQKQSYFAFFSRWHTCAMFSPCRAPLVKKPCQTRMLPATFETRAMSPLRNLQSRILFAGINAKPFARLAPCAFPLKKYQVLRDLMNNKNKL